MGSTYATIAFASATVLEIIGYYVPWFDHVLDTIATPAAVVAGTVTTAAVVTDISPFLKWTMALIAGGDFDVVKTSATAWQWRFYDGQLGTDRTASVFFALERGNMSNPTWRDIRTDEKTVCIVGGQGEESSRTTAIRTGTNYDASTNNIEMFQNATDVDTTDGLNARGDAALDERKAQKQFEFDVIQTPGSQYGTHYTLGDLVTAVNPFSGASVSLKIDEVAITVSENGEEKIDVKMAVA